MTTLREFLQKPTPEEKEIIEFVANEFKDFLIENPSVFGAMARKEKVEIYMKPNPDNPKELQVGARVFPEEKATNPPQT